MYYEEKVINGVLCHRNTPNGEWIQFTLESLTMALIAMRGQVESRDKVIEDFKLCFSDMRRILKES